MADKKNFHIHYYAGLQDQAGKEEELFQSNASTPRELFHELKDMYHFSFVQENLVVAVNDEYAEWDQVLQDEDTVVFIPPFSGGA